MKNYVEFEIKPNLPVLGKEYGRLIPQIKQKIAEFNQMELATKVEAGNIEYIEIGEVQIPLSTDNLLVTMQGKDGFAFSGTGEIGVVIETLARDILYNVDGKEYVLTPINGENLNIFVEVVK